MQRHSDTLQAMMSFCPIASRPAALLSACPAYKPTPLVALPALGAVKIIGKDETGRMNLGSFKALGGVYAVAQLLHEKIEDQTGENLRSAELTGEKAREIAKDMTFVCASAGNHGLSVAAGAKIFGAKARIYLSRSVPASFASRLEEKGAKVVWAGDVYEESMDAAMKDTEQTGAQLLADSTWHNYSYPPSLVMEGYSIMAEEMRESFEKRGDWPDHVFLQAGVGGLAAGIAHMIRENWTVQPEIYVVEPTAAPCLGASHNKGELVTVEGPVSNMGRLDCKTPSVVALHSLSKTANHFITITDEEAVIAQRYVETSGIRTTPSGAAGLGAILASERLGLKLKEGTAALVILSEGAY